MAKTHKNPDYVLSDLETMDRLLKRIKRDYRLAHDVGYSKRGSGPSDRITGSLDHDEVASVVVDGESSRNDVFHAAKAIGTSLRFLDTADAAISRVVGRPDGPKTREPALDARGLVNRAELADAREAQTKRRARGEG